MDNVLNPVLFSALQRRFGQVEITNRGVRINWSDPLQPMFDPIHDLGSRKNNRSFRHIYLWGESYHVDCPLCGDTRKRLFFSHCWGVWDPATQSQHLELVKCFNEECMVAWDNKLQMRELLLDVSRVINENVIRRPTAQMRRSVQGPGVVMDIRQVLKRFPGHSAVRYLRDDRGFDLEELGARYSVSYCFVGPYEDATGRVVFPIRDSTQIMGWQARRIGEEQEYRLDGSKVPKYFTSPNLMKSEHLYATDLITQTTRCLVVVEGATDCWAVGPGAVGLLGKTISPTQISKLVHLWQRIGKPPVALMLDPDQAEKDKLAGLPHHMIVAWNLLFPCLGDALFPVRLPSGTDAAKLGRIRVWQGLNYLLQQRTPPNQQIPRNGGQRLCAQAH